MQVVNWAYVHCCLGRSYWSSPQGFRWRRVSSWWWHCRDFRSCLEIKKRRHELSTRRRRYYSSHQLIYVASHAENRVITTPTSWTGGVKVTLFFIRLIRRQCFQRHFPNLDKVCSSQHCKPPAAVIIDSLQRPNNHSQMTGVSRKVSHLSGKEGRKLKIHLGLPHDLWKKTGFKELQYLNTK